jgi:simple sugar transport system ATP-binding protein
MVSVDETQLADAMLGRAAHVSSKPQRTRVTTGQPVADLRRVSVINSRGVDEIKELSLVILAGEIVGIAALEGAAKPVLRLMAGRLEPTSGEVIRPGSIGFVPEDRSQDAVIADFSLSENMALRNLSLRSGILDWTRIKDDTDAVVAEYDVRVSNAVTEMADLSGGNQQKFVLGRELTDNPQLLVLENPTQGLDVHAASAIHDRILSARVRGTAVVIYSSDIDELVALADRVLVITSETVVETQPDRDAVGRALLSRTG